MVIVQNWLYKYIYTLLYIYIYIYIYMVQLLNYIKIDVRRSGTKNLVEKINFQTPMKVMNSIVLKLK